MNRLLSILACICLSIGIAQAAETPLHTIAVAGEARLLLPPDYATVDIGVVVQAASVSNALEENSARMGRVIAAAKALGVADKDLQTSAFTIRPKYEPRGSNDYDEEQFRPVIGYYTLNAVTVTVRDLANVAKIIDNCVNVGANQSGNVTFHVSDLPARLDDARRAAVESARHKAEILTRATHVKLGAALSITDNQADTSYNDVARSSELDTVEVSGSRIAVPIQPGLVSVKAMVTVVFATK